MDTSILKEIIVLADKKSFAAAADELFITQSSLSRHIQLAEKELGTAIFYRNSRKVELTKCGEILLPYAHEIIEKEQECCIKVEEEKRRERVELKIGSVSGLSAFGIMSVVAGFISENRDISVRMERMPEKELKDALLSGECDFIFTLENFKTAEDGFNRFTAATDMLSVVLPKDHPLANNDSVRLEQLKDESWFLQEERKYLCRSIMECFKKNNFTPKYSDIKAEGIGILELVEQGAGICMEQKMVAEEKHNSKIALIPVMPKQYAYVNLLWRNVPLGHVGKLFVNYIKKHLPA